MATPNEIMDFLKEQFGENVQITTPQFDRYEGLDFEYLPQNEEEFNKMLANAPMDILHGFGFRKWKSMNAIIEENKKTYEKWKDKEPVSIPYANASGNFTYKPDLNIPLELLEENEDIILFPVEWYDCIPEGFNMTDISGKEVIFQKGITSEDCRFGCLAYGIRRKCLPVQ